jgi:hypothetical protein
MLNESEEKEEVCELNKQVENMFFLFLLNERKCNSFLCHQIYTQLIYDINIFRT